MMFPPATKIIKRWFRSILFQIVINNKIIVQHPLVIACIAQKFITIEIWYKLITTLISTQLRTNVAK